MTRRASLELLLSVRALSERLSRRGLADAAAAQRAAEQQVEELEESLDGFPLPSEARSAEWVAATASRRSMATLVTAARQQAAAASGTTDLARAAWVLAERDRESMQRLTERVAAEHQAERNRQEQRENDDLVVGRHSRDAAPRPATTTTTTGGMA